jgi:hypothetical protein
MMGLQQIQRPSAAGFVDTDEVFSPSPAGEPLSTDNEELSPLDTGRLKELAASLGVTLSDVARLYRGSRPASPRGPVPRPARRGRIRRRGCTLRMSLPHAGEIDPTGGGDG